jgi:hypothetical protein
MIGFLILFLHVVVSPFKTQAQRLGDTLHGPALIAVESFGNSLPISLGHRLEAEVRDQGQLDPLGVGVVALAKVQHLDDGADAKLLGQSQATVTDQYLAVLVLQCREFRVPAEAAQ